MKSEEGEEGKNGKQKSRKAEKHLPAAFRQGETEKQMTERFPRSGMTYDSMSSEGTPAYAGQARKRLGETENRETEKQRNRKAEKQKTEKRKITI